MIIVKLKELLQKRNKSAYWLAKQTNISQNAMGKIVNGEPASLRFDTLDKICDVLECEVEDILQHIPKNED